MNRLAPHVSRSVAFHSVKGRSFAERKTTLGESLFPPRSGATLVEVLMALLIMAIGVTSVFTLFPLSILKALKANQLTNAKLYEGVIKDTLLAHPQVLTGAPAWSDNTVYGRTATTDPLQDRWISPQPNGRLVPDTNELFYYSQVSAQVSGSTQPNLQILRNWGAALSQGGYNNTYGTLPAWTRTAADGNLTWIPYRHSPYPANPLWSSYVVDPLGWHRVSANPGQFGNILSGASASTRYVDRIHGQFSSAAADQLFRLPDSWNEVLEASPVTLTAPLPSPTQIEIQFEPTLASTVDFNSLTPFHRVVLLSTRSSRVVVLPVQNASNSASGFLTIDGVLPTGFGPADFDQARIEIQAPSRYSWLMSVHSGPRGEFEVQCAVVFNRSFEALDEQGYRAEFCQTEDLDGDGAIDTGEDAMWPNGRLDANIAKVRWPYDPDADPPRIKEGGYIFDASHGFWYQIQKIEVDKEHVNADDTAPYTAGVEYVRTIMTLGDPVEASTSAVAAGTAFFTDYGTYDSSSTTLFDAQAVFIPGIIHVFPMSF